MDMRRILNRVTVTPYPSLRRSPEPTEPSSPAPSPRISSIRSRNPMAFIGARESPWSGAAHWAGEESRSRSRWGEGDREGGSLERGERLTEDEAEDEEMASGGEAEQEDICMGEEVEREETGERERERGELPPPLLPPSPPPYCPRSPSGYFPRSPPAFCPSSPPGYFPRFPPTYCPSSPPGYYPRSPSLCYSPSSPPSSSPLPGFHVPPSIAPSPPHEALITAERIVCPRPRRPTDEAGKTRNVCGISTPELERMALKLRLESESAGQQEGEASRRRGDEVCWASWNEFVRLRGEMEGGTGTRGVEGLLGAIRRRVERVGRDEGSDEEPGERCGREDEKGEEGDEESSPSKRAKTSPRVVGMTRRATGARISLERLLNPMI